MRKEERREEMRNKLVPACDLCKCKVCEGCFYAGDCERWNEIGNGVPLVCNGFVVGMTE